MSILSGLFDVHQPPNSRGVGVTDSDLLELVKKQIGLVTVWFRVLELDYVHQGELLWHIATQTNSVAKLSALH